MAGHALTQMRRPLVMGVRRCAAAAPGRTVSDSFDVRIYGGGAYDLSCYGPDGFARRLTGDLDADGATAEVSAALGSTRGGLVTLVCTNTGTTAVAFTVEHSLHLGKTGS
ncbi:phospholipase domain-containing protein [Streptomyces sp. B5E4]|uniref:phospholipase domain-containing protein n=1 Tax=Streptomyces sp. B5E4 TaxID=3153568 RepID=UPI00325D55BA